MGTKYFPPQIFADLNELQNFDGDKLRPDTLCRVKNGISQNGYVGPSTFRYIVPSPGAADATAQLIINPNFGGTGQWQCVDPYFNLQIPASTFNATLADGATVFTIPAGYRIMPLRFMQEIAVAWTGGTNSAIGLSSNNAAYNTKGDLMGGAGGDVAANLASGFQGTIGTKMAAMYATRPPVVLVAGNTIRFDRIVDVFAAGSGILNIQCLRIF